MFRERLISGIVLVAAALIAIIAGGPLLFAVLLVVSLIGMHELYGAVGIEEKRTVNLLSLSGYAAAVIYYICIAFGRTDLLVSILGIGLCLVMAVYVFTFPRFSSEKVMMTFFGVVYVAVLLSFIYQTRVLQDGAYTVWLIFITSWGSDTCAYCVGRLLGRHKMAPVLSPKKSIEGAVGGVLGAAGLGALYGWFAGPMMQSGQNVVAAFAVIGVCGSFISMTGDLAASAIKRDHHIKDYGRLIPGHGGILDRFDSVIFTAPVIFLLAELLIH